MPVVIVQQRPLPAPAGTLELLPDTRVQVDHESPGTQAVAAFRIDDGATAGCKHDAVAPRQFVDYLDLALAKPFFAFFFEDE